MRWQEIVEVSNKYRPSQDEIDAIPYDNGLDPEYADYLKDVHAKEPFRGPHEGRELQLLLARKKAVGLIPEQMFSEFEPYIKSGQLIWQKIFNDECAVVGLPDQSAKITMIIKILKSEFDWDSDADYDKWDDTRSAKLGLLLGYTKEHIRKFINHS